MSRVKAENTAYLMTEFAQQIIKQDATPILCISLDPIGKASLYVNKDIDEAKIVLLLRTTANNFEEQEAKKRGLIT